MDGDRGQAEAVVQVQRAQPRRDDGRPLQQLAVGEVEHGELRQGERHGGQHRVVERLALLKFKEVQRAWLGVGLGAGLGVGLGLGSGSGSGSA